MEKIFRDRFCHGISFQKHGIFFLDLPWWFLGYSVMDLFRATPPYRFGFTKYIIQSNHLERAYIISTPWHLFKFTKQSFYQSYVIGKGWVTLLPLVLRSFSCRKSVPSKAQFILPIHPGNPIPAYVCSFLYLLFCLWVITVLLKTLCDKQFTKFIEEVSQ